ncbi:NAD(P)/FAD-dependent oxidoreductase [Fictibacillus terranigra]|uniref:Ferredoxin--NADP reductase n=1 Tax=Fictibacillus terranigra TaxID=3058424 RepID=A0ABT8E3A8_9BACL|nr:NAD(P)/FAD-dependent oxidoreductase [Fictibacillus sp. CENA-BCM004]MDN4072371.1 NAD(P)/FAD-dependent oxidoreductase [Fictibacillus sp. CENA-BCM004]
MTEENLYDITIIGGGPTGLFAAFYGGMRQMKVKIIESMPQLGGQLAALYPEKYIYDVAGFPKVLAQDLVNNLKVQAEQFNPEIVLEESVQSVEKKEQHFELTTDKDKHYSKAVIITAGVGAFQPRRLELDEAKAFEGKNLHYFVNDLQAFEGKKVLVAGGGDSAVDWSLMLEPIAEEVTLTHRRPKFRAHEHSVEQLLNSNVQIKTPYQIKELANDGEKITHVILENGEEQEKIDVDAVIVNYGFVSSLGPIKNWGLDIERNSIIVNSRMETNVKGIYAAGDICSYDGKVKLIAAGFGEAPTAVNNAKTYIDPKAKTQPQHSTSLF